MTVKRQLTGRDKPLVRLWDRDSNLVYSGEGDIGEVIGELSITVDPADGSARTGGRITSVSLANFTSQSRG